MPWVKSTSSSWAPVAMVALESMPDKDTDTVDEAWKELLASWDDESAHVKFLAACDAIGLRRAAGERYSRIRREEPDKAEVAQAQLDKLIAGAWASVPALSASRRTSNAPRIAKVLGVLFALCLIGVSGYAILKLLPR